MFMTSSSSSGPNSSMGKYSSSLTMPSSSQPSQPQEPSSVPPPDDELNFEEAHDVEAFYTYEVSSLQAFPS